MVRLLYIALFLHFAAAATAQSSVLSAGKWYKVAVDRDGVYRITRDQFSKMGFNPASVDPRKIKIYGLPGGMLPQENSVDRPSDPVELAILVTGESDGIFNSGDYILFYGQGAHRSEFIAEKNIFFIEQNLYAEENYYFVTVSDTDGKRVQTDDVGSGGIPVTTFRDFVRHEIDQHNELKSGRRWYGERFDITSTQNFTLDIPGIADEVALLVSDVMSQSVNLSSFKVFVNDVQVGEQIVDVISDSVYGAKGRGRRDTLQVNPAATGALSRTQHVVSYNFQRGTSGKSIGYLDFFSLHVSRKLALYGNQTRFRNSLSVENAVEYRLAGIQSNTSIWNVSNFFEPRLQQYSIEGQEARFSAPATQSIAAEYIIFNQDFPSPRLEGPVEPQNLHGLSTPDYLIVTTEAFRNEAARLAEHRAQLNNWSTAVVTTEEIYNEFSSGRHDVTAIRDFIRHLYVQSPRLKNVLLFGKSSFDYKQRVANNTNFVPTYESRNSLSPLETYSSDDYFGFLEEHEGEWAENNFIQTHTMDIGVGRLPVKSAEEARVVVDKLIRYDIHAKRFGHWRKDIVFVADDGSISDGFTSIHQSQANLLAENIETNYPWHNTRKLFLGVYQKNVTPNGESIPKANEDLINEFNRSVIINYTGHGSEKLWADERVLTESAIASLTNESTPFLVTATCEFGRHDDPTVISGAEQTILKPTGGSIGLVTTARPVNSNTNFALNIAFYDALFELNPGNKLTIGEVFMITKNNSTSGVANRNFSLLGDPGMRLALPSGNITVDEIKTADGSDTLKALSTVRVKGRVETSNGETDASFNGVVNATLFDKRTPFVTIGKNNPVFNFKQWYNPLFRGEATVKDGTFEFEFMLPRNIAYEINYGKLSLYAFDDDRTRDVAGGTDSFKVGGSETDVAADNKSPEIEVFMGDTTFINGGVVSPDTYLVVKLSDESGINISNYGIGNTMMAVLDDDVEVFLLNDYYVAEKDNFTRGRVRFPLRGLSPGTHTITVKAWDTFNNPAEKAVQFTVTDGASLVIESFGNYPNPVTSETTFVFTHNRSGEELEGGILLLSATGQTLKQITFNIPTSTYEVRMDVSDLIEAKKLPPGLYFGRLWLRSLSDGIRSERVTKLIVSK